MSILHNINYQKYLDDEYERKINDIVNFIKRDDLSRKQKLQAVYDFMINNCKIDDSYLNPKFRDGTLTKPIPYSYGIISKNGLSILAQNKYGPILCGKGICKGLLMAYQDIIRRSGIYTERVSGKNYGIGHGWLIVEVEGEIKHIDVFAGISNKRLGKNEYEWFLMSNDELRKHNNYSDYDDSLKDAIANLKRGFTVLKKQSINLSNSQNNENIDTTSKNDEYHGVKRR